MALTENKTKYDVKKSLNILLIDDNEQITSMLEMLFKIEGHTCTISNDGMNGLNLIQSKKYDVVLLDLALPDFDGYDVIESLEKTNKIKENKIIVFTASNISQKILNDLMRRGIHSYILKPVELDELLDKISEAVGFT